MAFHVKGGAPRLAALVAGLSIVVTPAPAQTLRGLVLESGTDRPVPSASVAMLNPTGDTVATALSDERGLFSVTADEGGRFRLVVRALGYHPKGEGPFDVEGESLRVVQVLLEPRPLAVPGVDVETEAVSFPSDSRWLERQGFYERRKFSHGRFFGPEDIAREAPLIRYTTELFYRIPGVTVRAPSYSGGPPVLMRTTTGGECAPAIFVDGALISGDPEIAAPLRALAGAEVYTRSVQVPLRFQMAARGCGVILLWTKG